MQKTRKTVLIHFSEWTIRIWLKFMCTECTYRWLREWFVSNITYILYIRVCCYCFFFCCFFFIKCMVSLNKAQTRIITSRTSQHVLLYINHHRFVSSILLYRCDMSVWVYMIEVILHTTVTSSFNILLCACFSPFLLFVCVCVCCLCE